MRRLTVHAVAALVSAALGLGCGVHPNPDAGVTDVPPRGDVAIIYDGTLELGEGETTFRPIVDGDTLLIARGCQGSQHVWITLRATNLDPRGMTVRLNLVRTRDGAPASLEFYVRLSFDPVMGEAYSQLSALTVQIPMPTEAIGEELVLSGEISDRAGHGARAERRVMVDWGTEVCGSMGG